MSPRAAIVLLGCLALLGTAVLAAEDYDLPAHAEEEGYEAGDFKKDAEDEGVVRSEHAPWFDHNKTKYWYAERHPAHHGHEGDDEVADAEWRHSHTDYDFAMQAGGGFQHHHVKDPRIAHVIASFHPVRMQTVEYGTAGEAGYKMYFTYEEKGKDGAKEKPHKISPWHDIPLVAGKTRTDKPAPYPKSTPLFHFLCEIGKGTTKKFELNKELKWNPIQQDTTKDGELREYKYKPETGSLVNYGALVQTWEDPTDIHKDTGVGGDNDPIDVLQLNSRPCKLGELQTVRVLGALALVDGDETDWKIVVVENSDLDMPIKQYNDITDVATEKLDEIREWFMMYKTAEGKGINKFGLDGKYQDREYAIKVIYETHKAWKRLMHAHHDKSEL